jgi:hypothetical protein
MEMREAWLTWLSLVMAILAVGGITGCLIYLRVALRDPSRCRSVARLVVACAVASFIGFGLATWDCLSRGQLFTPQRPGLSKWEARSEH